MIQSISFIGAGNVSTHFAKAFFKAGKQIDTILSRRLISAKKLAVQVEANPTTSYKRLSKTSDLYIIAVPDDAIEVVVCALKNVLNEHAFVVHTSGATAISSILTHFKHAGFIWPPQSLSKQKEILFSSVPICYGASFSKGKSLLLRLLKRVSHHLQQHSDDQKLALHLAAVFTNNFTNHMYHIAYDLCEKHKLDFSLLYPIILETAQKVINEQPNKMQTGPAIRDDMITMKKHKALLEQNIDYKKIYSLISKSIQDNK